MSEVASESVVGKAPEAFRTIGEVASLLGVRQHVLRYWEDQFPQLRPLTRAGGRRYYRIGDVALAAEINRLLHTEGFTIRGARQLLSARGDKSGQGHDAIPLTTNAPVRADAVNPDAVNPEVGSDPAIARYLRVLRNRLASALECDAAIA